MNSRASSVRRKGNKPNLEEDAAAVALSGAVFYSAVSVGQAIQIAIGVNTGRPSLAAAASIATLAGGLLLSWEAGDALSACSMRCKSSCVSLARAADKTLRVRETVSTQLRSWGWRSSNTRNPLLQVKMPRVAKSSAEHYGPTFAAVLGGFLIFGCLGGRVQSLVPSDVRTLGAFARTKVGSLPASLSYATDKERAVLAGLGRRFGCHTCGATKSLKAMLPLTNFGRKSAPPAWSWIADHQPPIKIAREMNSKLWRRITGCLVRQRFYPQCSRCSSVQSTVVRNLRNDCQGAVVSHHIFGAANHAKSPLGALRAYHTTGAFLVGTTVAFDYATQFLMGL
mmetsp:Transcript_45762/g.92369  ORF Transcript_45762/g.92369 Transcript_45762/m.92369 type:complete len:339 (-) Transcript_45762:76-1092(-)